MLHQNKHFKIQT